MKQRLAFLCSCLIVTNLGLASVVVAAPQTFNTALPIAEGEFILREQFMYRKASDDPGPTDRELNVSGAISVLGYGVNRKLAVFGVLPYLDKELDLNMPGEHPVKRDTKGIGDSRLFARYTLYQDNDPGRTFRIAPFLGIELPTGNDDDHDSLGALPAPLQLGSGSWDPFGGIVLTYQTLAYQIDAQASYKLNTEANNFEFGDEVRLDASLQYRIWPRELGSSVPGFLYTVVEGNFLHRDNNELSGIRDSNSGSTSFDLALGIQYVTTRWIIEGIVQKPVSQDFNGTALEDDFTIRMGFRLNY